jgi:hypothetical protein
MAYTLTYSGNQNPPNPNGSANTTLFVPDGSFAGIGNVTLPGRNFNGYGSPVDQSLLSMLENFASTPTGPSQAITGQLWYDTGATTLKYNICTSNVANWALFPQMDANGDVTLRNLSLEGNLVVSSPGTITGNGNGISDLNASNLSTGVVPSARLSGTYSINVNGNVNSAITCTTSTNYTKGSNFARCTNCGYSNN